MTTIPPRFSMMAPFKHNAPQRFLRRPAQAISLSAAAVMGVFSLFADGPAHALVCEFSTSGSGCSYGDQWPGGGPMDLAASGPLPPAITGPVIGQWLDTNIFPSTTPYYFPTDKEIKFLQFHDQAEGFLTWDWNDRDGSGTWRIPPDPARKDIWTLNTSFSFSTIPASSQEYVIRITEPGYYFADAFLFADLSGTATVAKDIYTVYAGGPGTLIGTLTFDASATTPAVLAINNHQELYIIDRYTPGASGTIDAHLNGFSQAVPGPSPLIGASAAIGFCRKLRRRVKAAHLQPDVR